jgi:hypothetical protein
MAKSLKSFGYKLKNFSFDGQYGIFGSAFIAGTGKALSLPAPGFYKLTLTALIQIDQAFSDGNILFSGQEYLNATIELNEAKRPLSMNSTLRGLEGFIGWAMAGRRPTTEELEDIHEGLLDSYAPRKINIFTNHEKVIRTSSMTKHQMARFIDQVINHMATMDIPEEVRAALDVDMSAVWSAWYATSGAHLQHVDLTWQEYCQSHPVCEFSGQPGALGDGLEHMHIVSRGADSADIDESWNWARGKASIHRLQHQKGWKEVLRHFPHMKTKILMAYSLAKKLNYKIVD